MRDSGRSGAADWGDRALDCGMRVGADEGDVLVEVMIRKVSSEAYQNIFNAGVPMRMVFWAAIRSVYG
jgi:hypothetical protein